MANMGCQINKLVDPGNGNFSCADPANVLGGAVWEMCERPAAFRSKNPPTVFVCSECAAGYPGGVDAL
jgi:hypothetical protein